MFVSLLLLACNAQRTLSKESQLCRSVSDGSSQRDQYIASEQLTLVTEVAEKELYREGQGKVKPHM